MQLFITVKKEVLHKLVNIVNIISFCIVVIIGIVGYAMAIIGVGKMEELFVSIGIENGIKHGSIVGFVATCLLFGAFLIKEKYFDD